MIYFLFLIYSERRNRNCRKPIKRKCGRKNTHEGFHYNGLWATKSLRNLGPSKDHPNAISLTLLSMVGGTIASRMDWAPSTPKWITISKRLNWENQNMNKVYLLSAILGDINGVVLE